MVHEDSPLKVPCKKLRLYHAITLIVILNVSFKLKVRCINTLFTRCPTSFSTTTLLQVMCVQYWPASKDKDEEYGGIGVSVLKEEELANFHIRTIRLYKTNENDVSVYTLYFRKKFLYRYYNVYGRVRITSSAVQNLDEIYVELEARNERFPFSRNELVLELITFGTHQWRGSVQNK